jgi:hypothetical protein
LIKNGAKKVIILAITRVEGELKIWRKLRIKHC